MGRAQIETGRRSPDAGPPAHVPYAHQRPRPRHLETFDLLQPSFRLSAGRTRRSSARRIANATSLGGVETLIERRGRYADEQGEVPANLIRLSVGCEHVEDLWADLEQALGSAGR